MDPGMMPVFWLAGAAAAIFVLLLLWHAVERLREVFSTGEMRHRTTYKLRRRVEAMAVHPLDKHRGPIIRADDRVRLTSVPTRPNVIDDDDDTIYADFDPIDDDETSEIDENDPYTKGYRAGYDDGYDDNPPTTEDPHDD